MPDNELKEELAYFEAHREELLKQHPGKYALIKCSKCIGTYDSEKNAYDEGARLYGNDAFLIHRILAEDIVGENPAYHLGLLSR